MTPIYYVTTSPVSDLLLVAKWQDDIGVDYQHSGVRICAVPVGEVVIKPELMNRVFSPQLKNVPMPADFLGLARSGDGHLYFYPNEDVLDLAELTGWYVDKPERKNQGTGWALLELAFRLAYKLGFAGTTAIYDGLENKEIALTIMERQVGNGI